MKKLYIIGAFVLASMSSQAQPKDHNPYNSSENRYMNESSSPGPIETAPPPPPSPIPIDGGVGILLAMGAGYGVSKLRKKK